MGYHRRKTFEHGRAHLTPKNHVSTAIFLMPPKADQIKKLLFAFGTSVVWWTRIGRIMMTVFVCPRKGQVGFRLH
jgi:hypothetical protein